jgi:subtilisin-like proprotein convertase family protein
MKTITLKMLMIAGILTMASASYGQMFWNHAARFDGGTSSYIACPNSLSINIVGSLTMEAWVYPTTSTGTRYILFKGTAGAGYYLRLNTTGTVSFGTNGVNRVTSTATVPAGRWSHIAGTYNVANDEFRIFVNGGEDGMTVSDNPPASSTDSLLIGKFGASSFTGLIDEIRIWTKAVTPNNIRRNMYTSLALSSGQYVSLLFSMPFQRTNNNGTVFTLVDQSFNPISGNIGFNRGITPVNLGGAPSEHLSSNEALLLEGNNNSYAAIPSNSINDITGAVTLEAWINPAGPSGVNQYIFHKRGGIGNGYRLLLNNLQKMSFTVNNSSFFEGSATIQYNRWYHIAWVITPSGASSLYINGVLDAYFGATGTPQSNNDSLYIGRGFNGMIDEARLFKYERSAEDINKTINISMDASNFPPGDGFCFNFDGSAWANGGIQFLFLRGNTFFSAPVAVNGSLSPLSRADGISFQDGFHRTINHKRIPETGTTGSMIDDSIVISENISITDVNVFLSLNHGNTSEIEVRLISPSGQQVTLMNGFSLKGAGVNVTTIFDDQADSVLINNRHTHINSRIRPQNSLNSTFQGVLSAGVWRIRITDNAGLTTGFLTSWGIQFNNSPAIGIQNISSEIPAQFELGQNYPNPFNPKTNFRLQIADLGFVSIKIYDITGKEVATLVNEELNAGTYNIDFDASHLASGTYFYKMTAGGFTDVKKMVVVK